MLICRCFPAFTGALEDCRKCAFASLAAKLPAAGPIIGEYKHGNGRLGVKIALFRGWRSSVRNMEPEVDTIFPGSLGVDEIQCGVKNHMCAKIMAFLYGDYFSTQRG